MKRWSGALAVGLNGVTVPPRGHLAMIGDIFNCWDLEAGGGAAGIQWAGPGMLLNTPQGPGRARSRNAGPGRQDESSWTRERAGPGWGQEEVG